MGNTRSAAIVAAAALALSLPMATGRLGAATPPPGDGTVTFNAVPYATPAPIEVSFADLPDAPPMTDTLVEPGEVNPEIDLSHPGARRGHVIVPKPGAIPAPSAPALRSAAKSAAPKPASDPMLLQSSFAGDSGGGAMDQNLAEGDGEVVEASNAGITAYTRTGTKLSGPKSLVGLFGIGPNAGDPRILWDHLAHRFMIVGYYCKQTVFNGMSTCGFNEGIRLAVSQTADATGLWYVYAVADETMSSTNVLDDQPRIGVSDNKIIITWEQINPSDYNFNGTEMMSVFARGPALVGIPVQVRVNLGGRHAVVPTIRGPGVVHQDAYAVFYDWGLIDDHIGIVTVVGDPVFPNTVGFSTVGLKIAAMHDPPKPGGVPNLGQLDTRFLWATETQNSFWVGANDKCRPTGDSQDRLCARIIQVNFGVATDVDLARFGGDVYYPAPVGDCNDGHVIISATRSDGSNPPQAIVYGSPLPIKSKTLVSYQVGIGAKAFTAGRWGDYQGIVQQADDCDSIWAVTQYGGTTDGVTTGTQLSEVTWAGPVVTSLAPPQAQPGTTVDVFVRHFDPGAFVAFGATPAASTQFISGTHLRVTSPPHLPGTVDVTVTTLNGQSALTPPDRYTYPAVAYVTDQFSDELSQFDTATLAGPAPISLVSGSPTGLALSPDTNTAWVSRNTDDELVPVDLQNRSPEPPISLGAGAAPDGVAMSPDGATAFVASGGLNTVTAVDTATSLVRWTVVTPPGPERLAITPDGTTLFVTDTNANEVTPIIVSGSIPIVGAPIAVAAPRDIAITPDGATAYVTDLDFAPASGVSHVTPINVATHTTGIPIPIVATDPEFISILPTGQTAYVSSTADGALVPIALPANVASGPFAVGSLPHGSAAIADGSQLFVTMGGLNVVQVVDTATNSLLGTAPVGANPYDIALTRPVTPPCPGNGYLRPTVAFSPSPGTVSGLANMLVDINQCLDFGQQNGLIRTTVTEPLNCPAVKVKPLPIVLHNGDNPIVTQFVAPSCAGAYIYKIRVYREIAGKFVLVASPVFATLSLS